MKAVITQHDGSTQELEAEAIRVEYDEFTVSLIGFRPVRSGSTPAWSRTGELTWLKDLAPRDITVTGP